MSKLLLDAFVVPSTLEESAFETPFVSVEEYGDDDFTGGGDNPAVESYADEVSSKSAEEINEQSADDNLLEHVSEITESKSSAVSSKAVKEKNSSVSSNKEESKTTSQQKDESKETSQQTEEVNSSSSESEESSSSASNKTSTLVSAQSYSRKADGSKSDFLIITIFAVVVIVAAVALIVKAAKGKK